MNWRTCQTELRTNQISQYTFAMETETHRRQGIPTLQRTLKDRNICRQGIPEQSRKRKHEHTRHKHRQIDQRWTHTGTQTQAIEQRWADRGTQTQGNQTEMDRQRYTDDRAQLGQKRYQTQTKHTDIK